MFYKKITIMLQKTKKQVSIKRERGKGWSFQWMTFSFVPKYNDISQLCTDELIKKQLSKSKPDRLLTGTKRQFTHKTNTTILI